MKEHEVHQRLLNIGKQLKSNPPNQDLQLRKEMIFSKIEESERRTIETKVGLPWKKISIALACLLMILIPISMLKLTFYSTQNPEPIYETAIDMQNAKDPALLSFFPLSKSKETENLLAVVWRSNVEGNYTPIYNSVFETSNEPHDLTTVDFEDNTDRIALISTSHSEKNFLHYRAISLENNEPTIYMEENYVPDGKLETYNGWVKEIRATKSTPQITYVIFYYINDTGNVTFSTNSIQLHRGEYLILAGNKPTNNAFIHSNNILTTDTASNFEFNYPGTIYVANGIGWDSLHTQNTSSSFLPLNIEVIE